MDVRSYREVETNNALKLVKTKIKQQCLPKREHKVQRKTKYNVGKLKEQTLDELSKKNGDDAKKF